MPNRPKALSNQRSTETWVIEWMVETSAQTVIWVLQNQNNSVPTATEEFLALNILGVIRGLDWEAKEKIVKKYTNSLTFEAPLNELIARFSIDEKINKPAIARLIQEELAK